MDIVVDIECALREVHNAPISQLEDPNVDRTLRYTPGI